MTHPRLHAPRETRTLTNFSGMLPDGRAWLVTMGDLWVGGRRIGQRARVCTDGEPGYLLELADPCIPTTLWRETLGETVIEAAKLAADPRYLASRGAA